MLCSTVLLLSTLAAAVKPFSFLARTVAFLADMKPRSACNILTAFASRRAVSSTVPIPADLCGARSALVLGHALIVAVTIDAKSESSTALITTPVTLHSRSFPHDDTLAAVVTNDKNEQQQQQQQQQTKRLIRFQEQQRRGLNVI
jgi:hypothetical protein